MGSYNNEFIVYDLSKFIKCSKGLKNQEIYKPFSIIRQILIGQNVSLPRLSPKLYD